MSDVKEVTDDTFEDEVLKSDKLYLIDFWAAWCGPCRMVGPVVAELAEELGDKMNFGKVDTDSNAIVASEYNISSIPSLLLFKGGELVSRKVGFLPKEEMRKWLDEFLAE